MIRQDYNRFQVEGMSRPTATKRSSQHIDPLDRKPISASLGQIRR